jgi:hypothetical protein
MYVLTAGWSSMYDLCMSVRYLESIIQGLKGGQLSIIGVSVEIYLFVCVLYLCIFLTLSLSP